MKTLSRRTGVLVAAVLTVVLIVAIVFAVWDLNPNANYSLSCGPGFMDVTAPSFSTTPFIAGYKHITQSEITTAFVGQIGSGNFTLNKRHGTSVGDIHVGIFTLGNGATAYVASDNSTSLIIQLNSGEYVIVGTPNTDAFAKTFSHEVYPLNSPYG